MNNSIDVIKLLGELHLSYEDFKNFESFYQEYIDNTEKRKKKKELECLMNCCDESAIKYLYNVTRIHQRIVNAMKKGIYNKNRIKNLQDVEEISMILGLFFITNSFQKNILFFKHFLA